MVKDAAAPRRFHEPAKKVKRPHGGAGGVRMRLPVALGLCLAVLAGCLGGDEPVAPSLDTGAAGAKNTVELPPTPSGRVVVAQARGSLRLVAEAVMPERADNLVSGSQFEPSVVLHPEGSIVVTAADGIDLPPFLHSSAIWVSHDGGASFTQVADVEGAAVAKPPVGAEGHLALGADGNLYFVEMVDLANHAVSRSEDGGRSWQLVHPAVMPDTVGDRPWIAAGSAGVVAVAATGASGTWVVVSTDGGQTFPTQTSLGIGAATPYRGTYMSPLVMDQDDRIYLASAGKDGVWMHRSADLGQSFDAVQVHATENPSSKVFAVPAVDAAGTVYVAWAETLGGTTRVRYAFSTDRGATWSQPVDVTGPEESAVLPWIADAGAGSLAVAYYVAETSADSDAAAGPWRAAVTLVEEAASLAPAMLRFTANATAKQGPVCTQGSACGGDRELGDYLGVDVADGFVHVVWTDQERRAHWMAVSRA